jgi:hypothetical protein
MIELRIPVAGPTLPFSLFWKTIDPSAPYRERTAVVSRAATAKNLVAGGWGGVGQIPDVRQGQHERMSMVVRVLA